MRTAQVGKIEAEELDEAFRYEEYRNLIESRLGEERTTGDNRSEEMLHHSRMNLFRMKRLDRYLKLEPGMERRLGEMRRRMEWVVLAEGWDMDSAQILPVLNKMALACECVTLRILLRDHHLQLMEHVRSLAGIRGIPQLIAVDADSRDVLGTWGPRPRAVQQLVEEFKRSPEFTSREAAERLQKWYSDDRGREVQRELLEEMLHWDG